MSEDAHSPNKSNKIMVKKYFNLKDAINSDMNEKTVFILANEQEKTNGGTSRYYTVFPSFSSFLRVRKKYKHCHEILVDHINNKSNPAGRLVFDFDVKVKEIPEDFKNQVENIIIIVAQNYFSDIDTNKLDFVWSTSKNPEKFSKHLTVKNMYFDNWIDLSKVFYKLFSKEWDNNYDWIDSKDLVDFQIIRHRASLRMVGSSKIKGCPLIFDEDDKYHLTDSLIRIYFKSQRKIEQVITKDNLRHTEILSEFFSEKEFNVSSEKFISIDDCSSPTENDPFKESCNEEPIYPENIYKEAFKICNEKTQGIFKRDKISGKLLSLRRKKPGKCILSNKIHEHENAFLIINKTPSNYVIKFSCYRFCSDKKSKEIGRIKIEEPSDPPIYDKKLYKMAFEMFDSIIKNQFKMGEIKNDLVVLSRKKYGKCPISRKMHDTDNAFLHLEKSEEFYSIKFGCDSNCHRDKPMYIGAIGLKFEYTNIDSNFGQLANCKQLPKCCRKKSSKKKSSIVKI